MTTVADARATLRATLVAADIRVDDDPGSVAPPCVYIYNGGVSDMRRIGMGKVPWSFRVVCRPSTNTEKVASAGVGALVIAVLTVLRALPGWEVGEVTPDIMRTTAGSDYLSADVTATTMIDL